MGLNMVEGDRWVGLAVRRQQNRSNLTPERERHLLRASRRNDGSRECDAATTELWESHAKLVIAIATRHRRPGIELMDLIGAGHLGLRTAIDRFDVDAHETRLSSYAIGWIRWYVQDYINRNAGPVRMPGSRAHRQLGQMSARLIAEARKSCHREMVEPSDNELHERIGRRIGLSASEVAKGLRLIDGAGISLDDDGAPDMGNTLLDTHAEPEDDVILRLDQAKLRRRMQSLVEEILGDRERIVFSARCLPLLDDIPRLEDLAERLGVSRERVHQIETSAKRKMMAALIKEGYAEPTANTPPKAPAEAPVPAWRQGAMAAVGT